MLFKCGKCHRPIPIAQVEERTPSVKERADCPRVPVQRSHVLYTGLAGNLTRVGAQEQSR
jgi:hypothetical protein